MSKKRIIYIALAAYLLSVGTTFVFSALDYRHKLSETRMVTATILRNCTDSLKISIELINNCGTAYREVSICASDLTICDMKKSASKLDALNAERQFLDNKMEQLTGELESLLDGGVGR